jgi:hypothetical protein
MLTTEQEDLLVALVGMERGVPREQRGTFMKVMTLGSTGEVIYIGNSGFRSQIPAHFQDLSALEDVGYVRSSGRSASFYVTGDGRAEVERLMRAKGEPAKRQEEEARRYLDSDGMRQRHSAAYARWVVAEGKLWGTETEGQQTEIGHSCREAMLLFATSLVERARPEPVERDPQLVVKRVEAVLRKVERSGRRRQALEALLGFWVGMKDLVERQEHGALKEGERLDWEDGRRLVFLTMVVMTELDRAVESSQTTV